MGATRGPEPLKPQDIMVLLAVLTVDPGWSFASLAALLDMSSSHVHAALGRAGHAHLYSPRRRSVNTHALLEFIEHGIRYAFPAAPGRLTSGVPTAHSAPPLSDMLAGASPHPYVWPAPEGDVVGEEIQPLYPTAPRIASKSPALYALLALVDGVRVGAVRERKLAVNALKQRLAHDARQPRLDG